MKVPDLYDIQLKFIKDCTEVIKNRQIGIFSSPTGTGKTLSLLLSIKNFIAEYDEEDDFLGDLFGVNYKKTKIYYCSRTHSQLRQVINEFKNLEINTSAIVIASRKSLCINSTVNTLSTLDSINTKCRDLVSEDKCKFYKEHYKESGKFSIEDLVRNSKEKIYCPYYFSKTYSKKAELVFLPYNMLFDEDCRRSLDFILKDSIVIIDEAHNIVDIVSQIHTSLIKLEDLKRYVLTANRYKTYFKGSSKNHELLSTLIYIMTNLIEYIIVNSAIEKVVETSQFLLEAKLYNFNTLELTEELKQSNLILKLESFEHKSNLKLHDIVKFLKLLVASDESSRIVCNYEYIKIFPISSKVFFEPFSNVKSLILAGGTMEPIDELVGIFNSRDVVNFSYESSTRLFNCCILDTIGGKDIEIKHKSKNDIELFSAVHKSVLEIIKCSFNGGIVVFLPSKHYLETFKTLFKPNEELNLFYEGTHKFEEYALSTRKTKSLLFAVVGGTFSEGINFSDDLCRILIIIGVPYPNIDAEINTKIKQFGFDWYTEMAMKKVNQTIGRSIRHKDDYASIILIDKRYTKLKKYLSPWIVKNIQVGDLELIKNQIKEFFRGLEGR